MTQAKMNQLCSSEGLDFEDMADLATDSVSPGICMNEGCDYTTEVEPDSSEGWCEECDTNSVKAATELIMEGFLPND